MQPPGGMRYSSEEAGDGFSLLTAFEVSPSLVDNRQLWLTWTWKSPSLANQLFQQVKLIYENDVDMHHLGQHVLSDPAIQSYKLTDLRPEIQYLVCLRLTRRRITSLNSTISSSKVAKERDLSGVHQNHFVEANQTGYVAEMECRLAKTQAFHWSAFISCLLGFLLAVILSLVTYLVVRHWQMKTKYKCQHECHHNPDHHHHHYHHCHLEHQFHRHQRHQHTCRSCHEHTTHGNHQSDRRSGSTICTITHVCPKHGPQLCMKHGHLSVRDRQVGNILRSKPDAEEQEKSKGDLEISTAKGIEEIDKETAHSSFLQPPALCGSGPPSMETTALDTCNASIPGVPSLSGSDSYQITSASSTTEEHTCHYTVPPGCGPTSPPSMLRIDTGELNRPSSVTQHQQAKRTVSFLVSGTMLEPLPRQSTPPEKLRSSSIIDSTSECEASRTTLNSRVTSSRYNFEVHQIDSPVSVPYVTTLNTGTNIICSDSEANASDVVSSQLGDVEDPRPAQSTLMCCSPVISALDTPCVPANPQHTSVAGIVPHPTLNSSAESVELPLNTEQVGDKPTEPGKEISPVFYTQLIETI